jgi:hypothetical protein
VKFKLPGHPTTPERELSRSDLHAEDIIIKLDREVIARRLQQTAEAGE